MDTTTATRLRDFSCGLFLMFQILGTLTLYAKGRRHRLQRSAFRYMLYLLAISVVEFYVFFIDNFLGSLEIPLTDMLQMTVIPISLLLLYRLTHSHSMPAIMSAANVMPYFLAMMLYVLRPAAAIYDTLLFVALTHIIVIITYGIVAVRRFNRRLRDCFSSDENLSLHWLWLMLALFAALAATWLMATLYTSPVAAATYNVMCSLILGLLCYFVYRQEDMTEALGSKLPEEDVLPEEALPADTSDAAAPYHFAEEVEHVFRDQHIYLDPGLNINGLARTLGTNRTYISNYLNQHLHTTFYEYVNSWRIKRAKTLLSSSSLPMERVAEQAGFGSLSTFRRYFLKTVGMSPNEYRRRQH